jgi:uncharacterized membrane protein
MESAKRSVYKTISWHAMHLFMVALIGFIVTGSIKLAAILASAEFLWESGMYFVHERIWAKFGNKIK